MRAGISRFTELPYAIERDAAVIGAVVPTLPGQLRGRARLIELLVQACTGLEALLSANWDPSQLPLILCTRSSELPGPAVDDLIREIEQRLGLTFGAKHSAHLARGQVAAFEALAQARLVIANGQAKACLIAAVDSLLDARTLAWLASHKRLKWSRQSDGIIPGEAACVSVVTALHLGASSLAIHGLGFGTETATVLNNDPLLGLGMASACRAALAEAGLAMHEVDFRLSDVAGESYAFEELALAQTRLMRKTRTTQDLWHPGSTIGDCGAAAGLLQLAWAEQAFARGYAPGPVALAHTGNSGGRRAVALVKRT